ADRAESPATVTAVQRSFPRSNTVLHEPPQKARTNQSRQRAKASAWSTSGKESPSVSLPEVPIEENGGCDEADTSATRRPSRARQACVGHRWYGERVAASLPRA